MKTVLALAALALVGCSGTSPSGAPPNDSAEADATTPTSGTTTGDASADASDARDASDAERSPPTGECATTFGNSLTEGFGRIDGIVYAVQKPSDTACVMPNRDHVVLQVLMNGAVYRLVTNVHGSGNDPKIRVGIRPHALPEPAFAEGWHTDAPLDYATPLGAHADASFTSMTLDEGTAKIASDLTVGDPVSVYATSGAGRPESAHLIHRNKKDRDGAIVVHPTTSPSFLLFHFATQTF